MAGLRGTFEISGDVSGAAIEAQFPLAAAGAIP